MWSRVGLGWVSRSCRGGSAMGLRYVAGILSEPSGASGFWTLNVLDSLLGGETQYCDCVTRSCGRGKRDKKHLNTPLCLMFMLWPGRRSVKAHDAQGRTWPACYGLWPPTRPVPVKYSRCSVCERIGEQIHTVDSLVQCSYAQCLRCRPFTKNSVYIRNQSFQLKDVFRNIILVKYNSPWPLGPEAKTAKMSEKGKKKKI